MTLEKFEQRLAEKSELFNAECEVLDDYGNKVELTADNIDAVLKVIPYLSKEHQARLLPLAKLLKVYQIARDQGMEAAMMYKLAN